MRSSVHAEAVELSRREKVRPPNLGLQLTMAARRPVQ